MDPAQSPGVGRALQSIQGPIVLFLDGSQPWADSVGARVPLPMQLSNFLHSFGLDSCLAISQGWQICVILSSHPGSMIFGYCEALSH